jgi:ornithine carbamoyltransferase
MTMMDEFGRDLAGRTVAFIGDGNNVAVSLAALAARLGMRFVIASPEGFELQDAALADVLREVRGFECRRLRDPRQAVAQADVIYTDTWVSMGQEAEKARREAAFADYQVNAALLAAAPDHAIVLHCLPAYRGVEITSEVLDGPQSRAFTQAHNRLHAQKGLLAMMMGGSQ